MIPLAFACFLLAYIESVSAARALAQKNGYEIDPRQELLGLGAANLAASLGQGYPVAGGLSQSSVNDQAGARSPLALVFASITIALVLLFLTGLLRNLPNVVLAAIVLVAVKGLIKVADLRRLWQVSRVEFGVSMVALVGVLLLGILEGRAAGGHRIVAHAAADRRPSARGQPRPHPRDAPLLRHRAAPGQRTHAGRAADSRRIIAPVFQRGPRARHSEAEAPDRIRTGPARGFRPLDLASCRRDGCC